MGLGLPRNVRIPVKTNLEAYLPTQMAFSAFRHRCRRTDGRRKLAQIGTDMHVEKFSKCDR